MPLEHFPVDRRKKRPGGPKGSKFGYGRMGSTEKKYNASVAKRAKLAKPRGGRTKRKR